MFKHVVKIAIVTVISAGFSAGAYAADYISASVGYHDVIRQDTDSAQFGLEYRFSPIEYHIRPVVGGTVNTDRGAYGYAGLNMDVPILANQLYLIPNFAVGAYKMGDSKRLGGALEFRSGIELDYQLENAHRIGIALNHTSNAGIYKHNPGVETALVNYSIPTGAIFGN